MSGPLKKINNITASENTVTVYWPKASISVGKYIIRYRIKEESEWQKTLETQELFVEVSGLDYGETYEFCVFYQHAGKDVQYTEIREFSVPPKRKYNILYCTVPSNTMFNEVLDHGIIFVIMFLQVHHTCSPSL